MIESNNELTFSFKEKRVLIQSYNIICKKHELYCIDSLCNDCKYYTKKSCILIELRKFLLNIGVNVE